MRPALRLLALLLATGAGNAGATEPPVSAAPPPQRDLAPRGVGVEQRLAEIQRKVQLAARYPETARLRGVAGEARIGFVVEADGRAAQVEVLESSGSLALDRAAERAVREVVALPPVIGRVSIPVRFDLVPARPETGSAATD